MAASIYQMVAYHEGSSQSLNYKNMVFLFHDKRRAVNKEQSLKSNNDDLEITSSHCYFSLYAIKNYFVDHSSYFKTAWISQAAHLAFDEELPHSRDDIKAWVMKASLDANGKLLIYSFSFPLLGTTHVLFLIECA
jgi:serine protease inhibitor